jgi:DNA-binding winged helix-turn-helix (wHTH) protein
VKAAGEQGFELGDWHVDPARNVFVSRRDRREVHVEPRVMELLLALAVEPGVVISKERIVAGVWGKRAVGDDTIAAAVSRLRAALGDSPSDRYIETVSKRGYRLVKRPDADHGDAPPARRKDSVDRLIAKGLAALQVPLPSSVAQARAYFESAIDADADRGDVHAGLAQALFAQYLSGQGAGLLSLAKAAAKTATILDPSFAPGWSMLGFATLIAERAFAPADRALLKAIELNPSSLTARRYRAFALASVGKFAEAEREARAAVKIDRVSVAARNELLQMLLLGRRYRQATADAARALIDIGGVSEIWSAKGWAHLYLGEDRTAVDSFLESLKAWGADPITLTQLARAHFDGGFEAFFAAGADLMETQRILFVPRPLDIAMLRAAAGDAESAFAALEKAIERDDPYLLLAPYLPHLDRLRNYPRFAELLARMRPVS